MNDKTLIVPDNELIAIPVDTERDAEVPYMYDLLKSFILEHHKPKILEIGNVSHNYFNITSLGSEFLYDVIDLYEVGINTWNGTPIAKVINEDIRYWRTSQRYDLIFSISTFEHFGFVYGKQQPQEPYAVIDALLNIKSLLVYGGQCVFTVPMNWNPHCHLILDAITNFTKSIYIKRTSIDRWEECSKQEADVCKYGKPFQNGNAVRISWMTN